MDQIVSHHLLLCATSNKAACCDSLTGKSCWSKLKQVLNDFGLEIDLAAQIIKNNCFIYEVGVSYFSRTISEGKKITWIDGLKSYFYLFKVRFLDNTTSTLISIIISPLYMTFVGSYFGMGLGNTLFMIIFFLIGLIIGLHTKIFSSLSIFLFIYIGSLFGNGNGKTLSVLLFFIIGIYIIKKVRKIINQKLPSFSYLF